ncbi:MAG: SCPU domain-containing protein [Candidatus Electrothrix sp. AU1_5]|nr:SCPU domain-containing protein [Candidatus Electrothrix gigas]
MKAIVLTIALLAAGTAVSQAAEKQSKQVEITLELSSTCVLNVNNVQGFGSWPTGGDDISGVSLGSVSVTCADGLVYAVGIDAGENYDGSTRRLSNGTDYVPYTLRSESSSGAEWGDTGLTDIASDYVATHSAQAVLGTGNGAIQSISLWGDATIPNVGAGQYADQVNITLVW